MCEKTLPTTNLAHYNRHVEYDEETEFGPDNCGGYYKMIHVEHYFVDGKPKSTVYFKPVVKSA